MSLDRTGNSALDFTTWYILYFAGLFDCGDSWLYGTWSVAKERLWNGVWLVSN